jgi:hypothetical protein
MRKKILLLLFLNGMIFLRLTGQVNSNKGVMVAGKVISTNETVGVGNYLFKYKIVLVETAKKDSVGILYDSTILEKRVNKLRIAKDSTYIFNIINPDGIDSDCTNSNLYQANDIIPLYNHIWIKAIEVFRKNK